MINNIGLLRKTYYNIAKRLIREIKAISGGILNNVWRNPEIGLHASIQERRGDIEL